MRRGHDAASKARVALEALKGEKTMVQLSSEFGVHANQIRPWRQRLLAEILNVFSDRRRKGEKEGEERTSELYRQIGWLKFRFLVTIFALTGLLGCNPTNVKPIELGNSLGVVLLHGKGGDTRWVDPLESILSSAGVHVTVPDCPWHRNRIYDKSFDDSMTEIQEHVNRLKAKGAKKVFLAGHSLGAIAAAGYGARVGDIHGVILLAPGHFVGWPGFFNNFSEDLQKADSMIRRGKGKERSSFGDINMGQRDRRYVSADIYMSWFSPSGPAEFVKNMSNLKDGVSVLYVAGSRDATPQTQNRVYAFDGAPKNSKNRFVIIDADHLDVPARSGEVVVEWLREQ